jgi:VWFA-related protein
MSAMRAVLRVVGFGAVFALALSAPGVAQPPDVAQPTPPSPPQTFKARTDIIPVDVTVVGRNGQPLTNLGADDFSISIAGKPRSIHSLQWIAARTGAPDTSPSSPRAIGVTTNTSARTGRLLVIAVDEGHLRFNAQHAVVRAAAGLLDRLGPGDLIAVARLPEGGGVEFTADRARVEEALRQVTGTPPVPQLTGRVYLNEAVDFANGGRFEWPRALLRECGVNPKDRAFGLCTENLVSLAIELLAHEEKKTADVLNGIDRIVTSLASASAPATIVLISEGLHLGSQAGLLTRVARSVAAGRVTVHVVRPAMPTVDMRDRSAPESPATEDAVLRDGLEQIAKQMGGDLRTVVGAGEGAFARIASELAGYYLLGIEPADDDRTGRPREIRVTVARPGAVVRARRSFVMSDDAAVTSAPDTLKRVLSAVAPTSGVPITVATYNTLDANVDRVRVLVSAEIGEDTPAPAPAMIAYVLLSERGEVVLSAADAYTLTPSREGTTSPGLFVTSFSIPRGNYSLRVAAMTRDGAVGSVHHIVRAALRSFASSVVASDLIVGVEPATGGPPRLTPSAIIDGDHVAAVIEVRRSGSAPLEDVSVIFELRKDGSAPPIGRWRAGSAPTGNDSQREYSAVVPLSNVPVGDYVLRAIVAGAGNGVIDRHFRYDGGKRHHDDSAHVYSLHFFRLDG